MGKYDYGSSRNALAEHWDGSQWTANNPSPPNIGSGDNSLQGVAAFSTTNVWAVGYYLDATGTPQTLLEHYDGSSWTATTLGGGQLTAITIVPQSNASSSEAWTVGIGDNDELITYHTTDGGGTWTPIIDASLLSQIRAVSASSSTNVWAVGADGSGGHPLALQWTGGPNWTVMSDPNVISGGYSGVKAISSNNVWLIGGNGNSTATAVAIQWNGSWQPLVNLPAGSNSFLYGIDALSATNIWAVGTYFDSTTGSQNTLVYSYDGTGWQIITSPSAGSSNLFAITINSANDIWAVGNFYQNSIQTLTEHYLPSTTPTPSGAWITPSNGFSVQAGTTLQLSANAYPALTDSSIQHVDFAANWNGTWQTVCTTTSSSNAFGCNWNLTDTNGTPIPNGALQVEFIIYDSSGTSMLSPVLQGTITPPQVQQQTSGNWAGYVVTGKQYTDVKGSWVQPAISCGKKETSFAAFWVGLDGSSSKTVEQIGTEAMCKKGIASYFVWYEMYPNKPVVIFTGLQPNDHAQAEVSYQGNDKFKLSITLTDRVNTWTNPLTVLTRKGAARNSAEWIAEAPCQNAIFSICTSSPWPQFGTVTFSSCSAGGISIASGPTVTESTMTYGLLKSVKGQPSSLDSNNTGFSVQWEHA